MIKLIELIIKLQGDSLQVQVDDQSGGQFDDQSGDQDDDPLWVHSEIT